jgi:hypothetical protein
MYVNGKMIPAETNPGMGGGGGQRRMVEGVTSIMIYLIYFKNFHKCHNVPPPRTTIKILECVLQKEQNWPMLSRPLLKLFNSRRERFDRLIYRNISILFRTNMLMPS